ncbi:MAG: ribosome recycling factor [Clostridia bacterium]|nr:ribosome recycling factor [Clostridia bacterium]
MGALETYQEKMAKTLSVLKEDLNTVRAGRANASLLDQISVDYYGTMTPVKNMANIQVPDPRSITITPFDPSMCKAIEKAIQVSNIGINPNSDGKVIRLVIPPLTEERRLELAKTIKKMGEESRVAVRNCRRDANEQVKKDQKDGLITEDDEKNDLDEIQKMTDKCMKDIDNILATKEKEPMAL